MGGFHLFTLADIPVRVSPWFFPLLVYFASQLGAKTGMRSALCVVIALLAHELGHAFVARHYKLTPEVTLHGFGGFTAHQRARTPGQEALIVAAGPFAGLALFGLCF